MGKVGYSSSSHQKQRFRMKEANSMHMSAEECRSGNCNLTAGEPSAKLERDPSSVLFSYGEVLEVH